MQFQFRPNTLLTEELKGLSAAKKSEPKRAFTSKTYNKQQRYVPSVGVTERDNGKDTGGEASDLVKY